MSLIEFIQDHRWWVLAISLPLTVIYGRVLVLAAFGPAVAPTKPVTAPLRRLPPKPGQPGGLVKPPSSLQTPPPEGRQEVLPNSLDAGATGHQKAGSAKTVKLPASPSKATDSPIVGRKPTTDKPGDSEADAMDGLFGKRDEPAIPSETPSVALRRKASRMEELGFHHGIANMPIEGKAGAPGAPVSAATPVTAAIPASPAILPDGTPRSSTAELTSILERIDKFLAEDTPAKPNATIPPSAATTALTKSVSDEEATAAKNAPTEPMKPVEPARGSSESAAKATEAMSRPEDKPAKPDPNKKTQPMWARPDAMDEDVEDKPKDEKKPDGGDQQRLF